jgi:hypothetical protein
MSGGICIFANAQIDPGGKERKVYVLSKSKAQVLRLDPANTGARSYRRNTSSMRRASKIAAKAVDGRRRNQNLLAGVLDDQRCGPDRRSRRAGGTTRQDRYAGSPKRERGRRRQGRYCSGRSGEGCSTRPSPEP